jgi:hypothetical protein
MPGEPIRLGPFVGGINQLSDPTALQDNELVDAVNLELDLDGSYIGRPPFYNISAPGSGTGTTLLGFYITANHTRLIGYTSTGIWIYENGAWSVVAGTSTVIPAAMVQYDDRAYIIASPLSAGSGGYIDDSGTYTVVSAIKKGGAAVIHKERLFIVPGPDLTGSNSTLLQGSAPADFTTYPVSVFINKGDGQKLMDIVVYNDNLLLFKEDSTYVLAYDSDPTQAITRKVNATIGVADLNCVVAYENQLYVLHRNNVYEVVNYDFAKINSKVPLEYDATKPGPWRTPTFLTILGDRLIVKYYARIYIFGLKTKVWTRWDTGTRYIGPAVAVPIRGEGQAIPEYILPTAVETLNQVHAFRDIIDSTNSEDISCSIVTKNYDVGVPHRYKRLYWWGANVSTISEVTGTVQPVIVNFSVTWDQLFDGYPGITWDNLQTWDQPLSMPVVVETVVQAQSALRKFVKFSKSLRFRQVNYKVEFSYDGTDASGPVRFFDITAIIGTRQHVSKSLT